MISRARWVSGAVFALLAAAPPCLADEPGYGPQRGALGGLVGGSQMVADGDYSNTRTSGGAFGGRDAQPRFAFSANLRYVISRRFRWQVSPGYFWAAYRQTSPLPFQDPNFTADVTKRNLLTQVIPISAQIQYTQKHGSWLYHVGAGPGIYRIWVENRRKVLKDPVSKVLHQGFYPGVSAQLGAERFLKALPSTAIEISIAGHWVSADRPEQFILGFNSSLLGVEGRVGANYYFDIKRFSKKKQAPAAAPVTK
jgi:hypothetical protein